MECCRSRLCLSGRVSRRPLWARAASGVLRFGEDDADGSYSTDEKGYEHAKEPERIDACAHGEAGNGASDVSDQINGGNDVRRVSIGFRQKQTEASREAHARCHAEGSGCEKEGGELFERHE